MSVKIIKGVSPRYMWDEFHMERPVKYMVDETSPIDARRKTKSPDDKIGYKTTGNK